MPFKLPVCWPTKWHLCSEKSIHGPSNPIHVIKKIAGTNQQVTCEIDLCKANAEFAERSNLMAFECHHLRSLTYCPPASTNTTALEADILQQMVQDKWFGDSKKQTCQQRQEEAKIKGVPLSGRCWWTTHQKMYFCVWAIHFLLQ